MKMLDLSPQRVFNDSPILYAGDALLKMQRWLGAPLPRFSLGWTLRHSIDVIHDPLTNKRTVR